MTAYEIARREIGVKEVRDGENPRILEYHDCTDLNASEDEVPWCSAFMNWCQWHSGAEITRSAAARSWLKWGNPLDKPVEGCVTILSRPPNPTSGHVAFFVRQQGDMVLLLGGNQRDQVKESWFHASSVLGYREACNESV